MAFSLRSHGFGSKKKQKARTRARERPTGGTQKPIELSTPRGFHFVTAWLMTFGDSRTTALHWAELLWCVNAIYYAVRPSAVRIANAQKPGLTASINLAMPHDLSTKVCSRWAFCGRVERKLLIFLWDSIGSRNEGCLAGCLRGTREHTETFHNNFPI